MPGITVSISSGALNSRFGIAQYPIKRYLIKRAEAFEQESLLDNLFRKESSNGYAESYTSDTAADNFEPVGEGGAYPKTSFQEGFKRDIVNETWKQSVSITREAKDDDKIDRSARKIGDKLVTSYYRTREEFARIMYLGGVTGTSVQYGNRKFPCHSADGQALFSKNHPAKVKGGNQSNLFADEFSTAVLGKAETRMQNTVGDNGELLALMPDTIWIPNDATMKNKVFEAIGSDKSPETSNNGMNYHFGRWNVIVDPYLNVAAQKLGMSTIPWFLLDSNFIKINDGAILQDRVPLEVRSIVDDNNDNNNWNGYARFGVGFVDWRFVLAGGVTGGSSL